ncbi:ketopantoate reductase family protein [Burkholderia sp. Ac-20365]|jgi:2-dehydropantoate 2-reductase|uniref:ketopantoate reductase family protein n=1 Tax=Burkholderia sp. Ac-20365 TaxID=2703897 RepID=UPI00197CB176|nr:ketopantoate reductase family protein [Burkholderia sp. Ac-20365]MBN3766162.1 ketopantoate reductase family protein [Burkholderia sp. Ac-20365]
MNERILIWGAGAIGGTIGAYLVRAGHDVTFVDIDRAHVEAIRDPSRGLSITGPVDQFTISAPALLPDEVQGEWSRIFLAVKAHHTRDACEALLPHLAKDGYVLSLQNGLCEKVIAQVVGESRTVGAFVNFGADWIKPGEIHYGNRGATVIGEIDGADTPRIRALYADIKQFEPDAILTDQIFSFLWGKLAYGSLLFAQAVGQLGIADCLERPELLPLWRDMAGEVLRVAHAEGVRPRGFNGFEPAAFETDASEAAARASVAAMVAFNRPNAKTHSGVWRDLAVRKRRTEVDMQIAPVADMGRTHGIACTKLEALVRTIHEIEDGERALSDHNLNELLDA